jgi:hypothetical protein
MGFRGQGLGSRGYSAVHEAKDEVVRHGGHDVKREPRLQGIGFRA